MKPVFCILLLFLSSFWAVAQNYAGEYVMATNGGEVALSLKDTGQGRLSGALADSDGTRYQVEGLAGSEYARGTLSNEQGGLYFEARLDGEQLTLTIMPADAYNQPDYLNARDFVLRRRETVQAPLTISPMEQDAPVKEEEWLPGRQENRVGGEWEGTYHGKVNETATRLSIQRYGNQMSGEVDAGGYKYSLQGAISGNELWGDALDQQTGGKMRFSGELNGNIAILDFLTEQGQFRVKFLREGAEAPVAASAEAGVRPVGNWVYARPPASGEFAPPQQTLLLLHADATFHYGKASAVRSNRNGRGVGRGQWKIEGNTIMINQGQGWKKFATYQLRGNSLFLGFDSGDTQEWKRLE